MSALVNRLSKVALRTLPRSVITPAYAPEELGPGIVHLGTGAFHRAHQAVYTDTALGDSGGSWRIIGANLRSRTLGDQLANQDHLYTVVSRDGKSETLRVIGAISRIIFAPEHPAGLIEAIGAPQTHIVTLTITEKGYCYAPAVGGLDTANDLITHDLQHVEDPRTAPGFLVAGLRARMSQDAGPLTVLSCDNRASNGTIIRTVVTEMADRVDPALATWIDRNVTFPSTMVDRITPAVTDTDRGRLENALGVRDGCPVVTEPFTQWVLEERFVAGRPAWEIGGATFVEAVEPFEKMKLRLLNGSHSLMAWLGSVAGYCFVHDVVGESSFRRLVRVMMDREITPTLNVSDFDLDTYKDDLLRRFANPSLRHATRQIAADGSQKLPPRILDPVRERLAAGKSIDFLALAVAAWMRYVGGPDENGNPIEVDDPLADTLDRIRRRSLGKPATLARNLLALRSIFGDELPAHDRFAETVTAALTQLFDRGVAATVDALLGQIDATPANR